MEFHVQIAGSLTAPEEIRIAESLGYTGAWLGCSPALAGDAFTFLGLAAARTERISLGLGVIVPHLRHIADAATALLTLDALAPGRVIAGVGSGFTSTALLNRRPVRWAQVEAYVAGLRELIAGREIDWDGTRFGLLHNGSLGIKTPGDVPIWVAAHGPKGLEIADRVADGVITSPVHGSRITFTKGPSAVAFYGTVLEERETLDSPRVLDAAGPGAALALHLGAEGLGPLTGSEEEIGFSKKLADFPQERRMVEMHRRHTIGLSDLDRPFVTPNAIRKGTMTGTREEMRETLKHFEATGATTLIYGPFGSNVTRELEAFADVAGL
ncbi:MULTISPECIES: LLM class flavin-dependent oxidoreductase [unclassified Pseudofrankia]|uniref:LLM class flavin-dependent oxidoreductase n=1 Tax=unclassified Pseudofrankia TaxID=2994372 RepID=UPI0008D915D4|nr:MULTISPECIES: LLM class flavin-dependent oxidoreductase [unclassified Pseudofrankia]MDT3446721.1 LLM class flavin-dependent oxidoreductase [Pseudofrankia sp. BMG5.37]OHV57537.1 hypothetical protein BCD48_43030 [Pseudofrankia sp. BMG5.36]